MNIAYALEEFREVDLPDDAGLDTSFADQFLKTFTRMARAQMKTQQTVSLAADDVLTLRFCASLFPIQSLTTVEIQRR